MPALESKEKIDKALVALRDYQGAQRKVVAAQSVASEKLNALKTITGLTHNDPLKIEEEVLLMVGRAHVAGVLEQ